MHGRQVGPAALGAFLCLCATAADGQDATWLSAPGSTDWDTAANWTPTTVPTGTATFGASNATTLTFSGGTFVGTIQFNAGAPAYTFDIASNFLEFNRTGVINNSSNSLALSNSNGVYFVNASAAGNSIINNASAGFTEFADTSSAGAASITNSGSVATTFFVNASTAGDAIINNAGGITEFANASTADAASITNSNGATTFFLDTSTAGAATITTNSGSFTEFNDASTAADATVVTNSGGLTVFQNTASGGQARFITNSGGSFDISLLSSPGTTVGSIAGAGDYFLGSKTLTIGSNNLSTEVSGVIADGGLGGGGGGSLVKVGGGTLTLTGANTYTGGTMISAGTLQIGAGGATGSIVGNVADNSALAFDRSDNVTFGGVISGTGSLTQLGGGALMLTGANTYTGGTTISAGTLQIGAGGTTGSIVGNVGDNSALAFDRSDNVTFGGVISGTGSLTQLGGGALMLTGANTYTGGTTISAGTLQIGAGGTTGSIVGNVGDNSALAFDRSDNVTFGGVISGTGSLTQLGGGALTLTGANTYTGGTTISVGTLQIGAGSTIGSIVGNVADNSALAFDRSDNVTFGGVISGTGSLTQLGGGALTLTGANTYTGGTTISVGTLQIGAGGTTGSIVGNVADNSALAFDRSDNVTFGGVISGTGSLTQLGGGALTLTGANTYTGGTTISAGTMLGGAANVFSAASLTTIYARGVLDLGGFAQTINAVDLAGGAITHGQLTGAIASTGGTINGLSGGPSLTTNASATVLSGTNALGPVTNGFNAELNVSGGTTNISDRLTNSGSLTVAAGAVLNASGGGGVDILGGSIDASGMLTIKTTNTSAAAVELLGNGALVLATGGGTIVSAGDAIEFIGGTNQTATFDNFTIDNQTGDLIFADPSVATINYNDTVANAGLNTLLDATNGSVVTLNASASTLTGPIQTDSTSTTNVNLTNGTTWTMTGSSTVTNLNLTNSVVVFAPPSSGVGFKTLTLNNYAGSGANIGINAALGGVGSASDQIVINGGKATGSTLLTIRNFGGSGGQTTGLGIPLVVTVNGGTTDPGAFALANTPVVGGYRYTLQESGEDWYLVSAPAPTQNDIANSVTNVAKAIQQQIITGRVLTSILLGATEQVNCSNCTSGFGSIGSYALGAHGRWSLSDEVTLMGGFSYDEYSASGITVTNAPTFAGSLVYDPVNFGHGRPFVEIGGGLVPFEQVSYTRSYLNGLTPATGWGEGVDRSLGLFGRVGWVDRLTPIDEAAVYTDISRSWLSAGGYTEASSGVNPFPATVQTGIDTLDVARLGAQYTHLFNGKFETNVSAAVAYGFGAGIGSQWDIYDFGPVAPYPIANSVWCEWGARIGYRVADRMVIDAFALGTFGGQIGTTFHGGLGLRYLF